MSNLAALQHIDEQLLTVLNHDDVNLDDMARLLNARKECLAEITNLPEKPEQEAWSVAMQRTTQLVNLIKNHRDRTAAQASQLIKGRKSVQIYKKFE
ncbi:hypothetical protein [Enterovibrio nigricans]|uniref:Flagellar rod protein FlaI n=1 Tax=Enterovibrio nigricans DSM 22720 TaxID=1121868 RepID=A0A1T4U7H5_9GAMM|nr:hypothetical protein [Enterovibrio nigricans]PKF51728.1 hypothetical protein AT251_01565 [Enterovibrio nigricans]SKA48461.1 flagellar rod protein FlaI [Enterovibrio nigricans DSM 22720]